MQAPALELKLSEVEKSMLQAITDAVADVTLEGTFLDSLFSNDQVLHQIFKCAF